MATTERLQGAPILDVRALSVALQTPRGAADALRDVAFTLEPGQTLGVIGESGCGKSMLALALMGLLPEGARARGSIRLAQQELVGAGEPALCRLRGNRMAMVFQEPMTALNPLHRVVDQVAEPLRRHQGLTRSAAHAQAARLLQRVRLSDAARCAQSYPHQLSGGQRQRVTIAMALACGPDVLIADEPTTALDVTTQREILDLMRELVADTGMALLMISHDLDAMARIAARIMVMYAGSVVESGRFEDVMATRAHPYTRGLFAARPRWGAAGELAHQHRLQTIPGRVPDLADRPVGCAFSNRCAWAQTPCQSPPALQALTGSHEVRCVRAAEPGFVR